MGWEWGGGGGLFLLFGLIDSCGEGENKQTDESCRIFGTRREVGTGLGTGLITRVMQACRLKTLNGPHELNNRIVHNEVGKIGDLAKFIYFPLPPPSPRMFNLTTSQNFSRRCQENLRFGGRRLDLV